MPNVDSKFPGAEKHEVPLADAKKYVQNHRKNPKAPTIKAGAFHRAIIDKILAQDGCDGIRIYHAQLDDGSPTFVVVGITAAGADLTQNTIAESIMPCPPFCDAASELL